MQLTFQRSFEPDYGRPVQVTPLVRRVTADNPSPLTFRGTNTFLVGKGTIAVIDPGPEDAPHHAALLRAVGDADVSHIIVTHRHLDHSGGVAALARATGAPVLAAPLDLSAHAGQSLDSGLVPDVTLHDGSVVSGDGWTLEAIATPGHLADHLCFALREEELLFSGDHVMAWSTTVVVPPGGSMRDYRASLARLLLRAEDFYLPAHGPELHGARAYVEALLEHRNARERDILASLSAGPTDATDLVARLYPGLEPGLLKAASWSVTARLIELTERGLVTEDRAGGRYALAG